MGSQLGVCVAGLSGEKVAYELSEGIPFPIRKILSVKCIYRATRL